MRTPGEAQRCPAVSLYVFNALLPLTWMASFASTNSSAASPAFPLPSSSSRRQLRLAQRAAMPPNPAPAFPLAESLELIVEACSEINCPLTTHEIQHPTPAKVQAVYEAWMLKVLDINLEDCIKAAKDQLDHMDHYVRLYQQQNVEGAHV